MQLVGVEGSPGDQLAARRLAHVDVQAGGNDDVVQPWLQRLGDERLEGEDDQGRPQSDHLGDVRGPAGDGGEDLARLDETFAGVDSRHGAVADFDAGDTSLLVDLDPLAVGRSGITPGDGVMAGDGAGWMIESADDGRLVSAASQVHFGNALPDEVRADHLAADAECLVDLGPPALGAQGGVGVSQREMAAFGIEQVETKHAGQVLPQIQAGLVEAGAFGCEVIGANDGGIAARAAAANVALFEDGDVLDAMLGRQVIGRRQPMPTAADDHDVVLILEPLRRAEHARLGIILAKREFQETEWHGWKGLWDAAIWWSAYMNTPAT